MGIHQSTVSRTFATVVEAIVAKADTCIQFPVDPAEFQAAKDDWQKEFAFPCAIDALDCTHMQILKPELHGDGYICRKGLATLNFQATCDASGRFSSVSANWPGSVHDSRFWKNLDVGLSSDSQFQDALFLGDEGYGIAPRLMTYYKEPLNAPQERSYNIWLQRKRLIIQRCFGQLKRRFPIV